MKRTNNSSTKNARSNFDRRVREQCKAIAQSGERESYGDFADRLGLHYGSHQDLIDGALTRNMVEDAKAGRPFASVAVVQGGGNGIPGPGFFIAAWELGCFFSNNEREFAEGQWQALCESCGGELIAA